MLFASTLFYLEHLGLAPAGGHSEGAVQHRPFPRRSDRHSPSWSVWSACGRQGSAGARWRSGWRDICSCGGYRDTAGGPFRPGCLRHGGWRSGAEWVVGGRGVQRRRGAAVPVLVPLLPLVQLPHGAGPRVGTHVGSRVGGQAEVAEAVLGVLVLSEPGGRGALAGGLWQRLVRVWCGELVLGRWCATREGVLSGGGAEERRNTRGYFYVPN